MESSERSKIKERKKQNLLETEISILINNYRKDSINIFKVARLIGLVTRLTI